MPSLSQSQCLILATAATLTLTRAPAGDSRAPGAREGDQEPDPAGIDLRAAGAVARGDRGGRPRTVGHPEPTIERPGDSHCHQAALLPNDALLLEMLHRPMDALMAAAPRVRRSPGSGIRPSPWPPRSRDNGTCVYLPVPGHRP